MSDGGVGPPCQLKTSALGVLIYVLKHKCRNSPSISHKRGSPSPGGLFNSGLECSGGERLIPSLKSKSLLSPVSSVNYGASSVFLSFTDFSFSHVYVGDSLCVCVTAVSLEARGLGFPWSWSHSGCELSHVGTGNPAQVLCNGTVGLLLFAAPNLQHSSWRNTVSTTTTTDRQKTKHTKQECRTSH